MYQKIMLIGHVGKDPEVRYLEGGTAVANLSLATSETYRNRDGEKVTNTEWHNVVFWRSLAEIIEKYVRKGFLIHVDGKVRTRSWDDRDGNKHYTTEVIADRMNMLGGKPERQGADLGQEQAPAETYGSPDGKQDLGDGTKDGEKNDLPF